MSNRIQRLPDHIANQIAAGEVVQRPASAVKELLENAVDAGATQIALVLQQAGKTLIQVVDNGCGMEASDAELCFERHATSKINKAEDLFSLVTKGFRGEALASIASVAQIELKTKTAQAELGTLMRVEGSQITGKEPIVSAVGSSFSVKHLFYNIPARRQFLKSDAVEWRHILDEFMRIALAHPDIQFTLNHNDQEEFHLAKGTLRQRIVQLFAGKTNEKLVPVHESTDLVRIEGFVVKPEFARKNRGEQFFFVNQRFIKSGYLHHAILSAFEGLLREGLQPGYFLFLEVPPHTIDVNIHPTKTEIKFEDEQAVYAIMRAAVKHALGQFQVVAPLDFDRDPNLDTPYHFSQKTAEIPHIQVDRSFNPFAHAQADLKRGADTTWAHKPYRAADASPHWESLYIGGEEERRFQPQTDATEAFQSKLFDSESDNQIPHIQSFQLQKKYIVSTLTSGLLIIHQQRAHQRIVYETLLSSMSETQPASQTLLFPQTIVFSAADAALVETLLPALQSFGFVLEAFDGTQLTVSAVPAVAIDHPVEAVLDELISQQQQDLPYDSYSLNDQVARSLAKSLAIQPGVELNKAAQDQMIHQLFACKAPELSPFGTPTYIIQSHETLEKQFRL